MTDPSSGRVPTATQPTGPLPIGFLANGKSVLPLASGAMELAPAPGDAALQPYAAEEPCMLCGTVGDEALLLLCDGCDQGYHTYCLSPPIIGIPEGEWLCEICEIDRKEAEDPPSPGEEIDRKERDELRRLAAMWN